MNTVCEVCGDIGFKQLLLCCRDCKCSAAHRYCLENVVFDVSLADWVCYECLQKRGQVTCSRSLKSLSLSCERPQSHAHEPMTKIVGLSSGAELRTNRKSHMVKNKSLNKLFSSRVNASQTKPFKRKPNMHPIDNCPYKRRQIATSADHAKSSCETIGAEKAKGNNGGNQHVENGTLNIEHPGPLIVTSLANANQSQLLKGIEQLSHKWKKDPQSPTNNVVLGLKKLEPSNSTSEHELRQRNMVADISQFSLQNNDLDKEMSGAPNDSFEKALSCASIKNIPGVKETNVQPVSVSSCSQHSNSSERFIGCQKGSFCHNGKTVKVATTSTSLEKSGQIIPAENIYLESDYLQIPQMGDYIISRTSYLSEAQKERIMAFIQETKPQITVFASVIGKSSVQLPGPYLGISKEYAFAYFPHETTKVKLQIPGMSKTWHPLFYKRNANRKNFLMGKWLDFVRDNNVQEGDICLIEPTKDERRSTFTVHLLRASATHPNGGDGIPRVDQYPADFSTERVVHEICHESLESLDSGDPIFVPYIASCRHDLSRSQQKIIEERVRAIRSKVPIYVALMKNNNAGAAQRWMLEIGVRYAAEFLPAVGQTVVLQRMGKTWNTQMVIHNGRRWFLNGGWTKFARDNGLRVGDICLFDLKENDVNLTMNVHIIFREQY